jgi:hypothetical protein
MNFCLDCGRPNETDGLYCPDCTALRVATGVMSDDASTETYFEEPAAEPAPEFPESTPVFDESSVEEVPEPVEVASAPEEVRIVVNPNDGAYDRFVVENDFHVKRADEPSHGSNVIAFLYPIVGFVLYFAQRKAAPKMAGRVCMWSWLGILFYVLLIAAAVAIFILMVFTIVTAIAEGFGAVIEGLFEGMVA